MSKTKSLHAMAAQAIRKELAAKYPTVIFSVKSKSYSGGNSVDVSWNEGPPSEAVQTLINKYQYGHFDGMQDLYEYSNTRKDIPQVKYVFAQRDYSEEFVAFLLKELDPFFADLCILYSRGDYHLENRLCLRRVLWKMDLTGMSKEDIFAEVIKINHPARIKDSVPCSG